MKPITTLILVATTIQCVGAEPKKQTEDPFPPGVQSAMIADQGPRGGWRVDLSNNTPECVCEELLDPRLLQLISKAHSLPKREAEGVRIMRFPEFDEPWLCKFEASDKTFDLVSDILQMYTKGRYGGHSRAFMMSCITNRSTIANNPSSSDLQQLTNKRPDLPAAWLKLSESGTVTNAAGTASRWAAYTVTDGDITWRYYLSFKTNGSLDYVFETKFDSKEADPQFCSTIEEVETLVTEEMKQDGSHGKFGSCHHFWLLKKKKLQERGILWRSPAELNPNTNFD
jgi:hypothetical protein